MSLSPQQRNYLVQGLSRHLGHCVRVCSSRPLLKWIWYSVADFIKLSLSFDASKQNKICAALAPAKPLSHAHNHQVRQGPERKFLIRSKSFSNQPKQLYGPSSSYCQTPSLNIHAASKPFLYPMSCKYWRVDCAGYHMYAEITDSCAQLALTQVLCCAVLCWAVLRWPGPGQLHQGVGHHHHAGLLYWALMHSSIPCLKQPGYRG